MEPDFPNATDLLPLSFFDRDPREVAPDLLGCRLISHKGGVATGGIIVEAEAYLGSDDPGSHAATRGMTPRNSVMYGPPGHAYVYFTYGNHHMLNFVCESEGTAGGALIRALQPLWGIELMTERRAGRGLIELTNGPGKLTAALGIDLGDNAVSLNERSICVYSPDGPVGCVGVSGRVGLMHGYEREYRFFVKDNPFVSRGRTGPLRKGKRKGKEVT